MRVKIILALLFFLIACNNSIHKKEIDNDKVSGQLTGVDTKPLAERANLFYEESNYQKAIDCYDSLIALDSTKGGYYFKRGYCKSSLLNNPQGAIADYKKAIERNYSEKKTAYLNLGVEYWIVLRKPDSAIYFYNECLKLDPNNEKAKQQRAEAMEDLKN
jgi:tetratricopeptide (TPR) repeat protein